MNDDLKARFARLEPLIDRALELEGAQRGSTRHIALTPEFAAPEQLRGELVTTRTDVYALGALLYLMLSGRSPHPRFDGNWAGYIDHVSQVDAPRLSRAASDAAGSALQPALLQGDLDAIVAKALQRDPASRYASADALAQDVRRFLGTRPVLARRQSWQYRSGKWMRRNWLVAVMLVGIAVALGAGLAGMAWRSQQVAAERDAAHPAIRQARQWFHTRWHNEPDRIFSTDYAHYADDALLRRLWYRIGEAAGLSTW